MQQLLRRRLTDTPMDVQSLLVCSSVDLFLNKEETLSEQALSTLDNNPEGVQHRKVEHLLLVFVQNKDGDPLMPCSARKARKLLQEKKAIVVKRFPFTIKLAFGSSGYKQKATLGVDSGYENIGFSATTETKELISGTVKLDSRTSARLTARRMYRMGRRSRHHWYRKPRFLNRTKKEGWLPPSVQRRYDTHLNLVLRLKKILPISGIIIETANFDIQKIMNPDISGTDYQHGNLYDYQNMRSYLMSREKGKCQFCGKDFKGQGSHIHHCKQRNESGSDRSSNLAILHKPCHEKLHKQGLKLSKPKSYKPNTFMSIIHKRFFQDITGVKITYGYITFVNRNKLGLEKSHINDAFVIGNGANQERSKSWNIEQKHRHNRILQINRKGFKPSIRTSMYKIQPKDLITINGQVFSVMGIQNKGAYVRVKDGQKVISTRNIESIYNFGGFAWNIDEPVKRSGFDIKTCPA